MLISLTIALVLGVSLARPADLTEVRVHFVSKKPLTSDPLKFFSNSTGWAFSASHLWKRVDGGSAWIPVNMPQTRARISGGIQGGQFFDSSTGIVMLDDELFETSNGGASWEESSHVPIGIYGGELRGLRFSSAAVAWLYGGTFRVANPGEFGPSNATRMTSAGQQLLLEPLILRTADGGNIWVRQHLPGVGLGSHGYRVLNFAQTDEDHGFAATEFLIFHTDDGGRSWNPGEFRSPGCDKARSLEDAEEEVRSIFALNPKIAWAAVSDGSLFKTDNGGSTWCEVLKAGAIKSGSSTLPSYFISLWFANESLGLAIELSGRLYESRDGGRVWLRVLSQTSRLSPLLSQDQRHLWAVGGDGLYEIQFGDEGKGNIRK